MSKALNELSNYQAPRDLVFREEVPYWPLKNIEDCKGKLSEYDVTLLDFYSDLIYKKELPLSVILLEKHPDLPTFNQFKLLLDEKCKADGMAFYDRLVENEHEILFGKQWKDAVKAKKDEDFTGIRVSQMMASLLSNKAKAVEKHRENQTTNINVFHGVSTDKLKALKDQLEGNVIEGEVVNG